jgi:hypothetical protein
MNREQLAAATAAPGNGGGGGRQHPAADPSGIPTGAVRPAEGSTALLVESPPGGP